MGAGKISPNPRPYPIYRKIIPSVLTSKTTEMERPAATHLDCHKEMDYEDCNIEEGVAAVIANKRR
jgi:hypothetical protein